MLRSIGLQGPKGPVGYPGPDGDEGDPGIDGDEVGDIGDPGDDAVDGTDGIPGEEGDPGLDGDPGDEGDPGLDGDPGTDGINGKDGIDGIDGPIGDAGDDGIDGTNGNDGPQGFPGVDGINGVDGVDGLPGKDGINGVNGKDGPKGNPGKNGAKGPKGKPGLPGANGTNGKNGRNGKDGLPGANGLPGRNGLNGTNGKNGNPGPDGNPGADGDPGDDGIDGTNGIDGATGDVGPTGDPGPTLYTTEILETVIQNATLDLQGDLRGDEDGIGIGTGTYSFSVDSLENHVQYSNIGAPLVHLTPYCGFSPTLIASSYIERYNKFMSLSYPGAAPSGVMTDYTSLTNSITGAASGYKIIKVQVTQTGVTNISTSTPVHVILIGTMAELNLTLSNGSVTVIGSISKATINAQNINYIKGGMSGTNHTFTTPRLVFEDYGFTSAVITVSGINSLSFLRCGGTLITSGTVPCVYLSNCDFTSCAGTTWGSTIVKDSKVKLTMANNTDRKSLFAENSEISFTYPNTNTYTLLKDCRVTGTSSCAYVKYENTHQSSTLPTTYGVANNSFLWNTTFTGASKTAYINCLGTDI